MTRLTGTMIVAGSVIFIAYRCISALQGVLHGVIVQ